MMMMMTITVLVKAQLLWALFAREMRDIHNDSLSIKVSYVSAKVEPTPKTSNTVSYTIYTTGLKQRTVSNVIVMKMNRSLS